ncbi:MAG: hypothetical protein JJ879_16080 [Sneathiella sp.]|nr:hypothetical protein [Sneathiella sp.]
MLLKVFSKSGVVRYHMNKGLKILRVALFLLLPIFLWWAWNNGKEYYQLYTGKTPMYDVSIELEVGGEEVSINRRVPCFKEYFGEYLQYLFESQPYNFRARDLSTGALLEDGRAVLVTIPDACKLIQKAKGINKTGNLLRDDFIPISAIADSPANPQLIKVFAARSYFEREDAELKFKKFTLEPAPEKTFPDGKDQFDWFRGGADQNVQSSGFMYFENVMISKFPYDFFAKMLPAIPNFHELNHPINVHDVEGFVSPNRGYLPAPGGIFSGSLAKNLTSASESLARHITTDHVIPAMLSEERYGFEEKNKGILILSRSKHPENRRWVRVGKESVRAVSYPFKHRGSLFTVTSKSTVLNGKITTDSRPIFYDPKTDHFYYVKSEYIKFPIIY